MLSPFEASPGTVPHLRALPPDLLTAPHIGVDEAGRGCLAGPVVAGAVFFPPALDSASLLPGLTDSKKLTAATRETLYPLIRQHCLWGIGVTWPREIDAVNILNASLHAMIRAVVRLRRLTPLPTLLIDGNQPLREAAWKAISSEALPRQMTVIKGDSLVPAISAASILAKVFRDKLMLSLDRRYPQYAFATHKGYGTEEHRKILLAQGPCPAHRSSFSLRVAEQQYSLEDISRQEALDF